MNEDTALISSLIKKLGMAPRVTISKVPDEDKKCPIQSDEYEIYIEQTFWMGKYQTVYYRGQFELKQGQKIDEKRLEQHFKAAMCAFGRLIGKENR